MLTGTQLLIFIENIKKIERVKSYSIFVGYILFILLSHVEAVSRRGD